MQYTIIFQAYEYEQSDKKPGFLQEFFDSTEGTAFVEFHAIFVQENFSVSCGSLAPKN